MAKAPTKTATRKAAKKVTVDEAKLKGLVDLTMNTLVALSTAPQSRMELGASLGATGYAKRNLYTALGYIRTLTYKNHYLPAYRRNPLAKAVIRRPVNESWRLTPTITETEEKATEFEKKFVEMADRLRLFNKFKRVDTLATLGKWAVLFIGFDDGQSDLSKEVTAAKGVLYVQPYSEGTASIKETEKNPANPRFGLPSLYSLSTAAGSKTVHWSRVIHVVEDNDESEVEGNPALEVVYNDLTNVEKVAGGAGEMFWRGGFPGFNFKRDPEFDFDEQTLEKMRGQIEEYVHGMRRYLRTIGVSVEQLLPQIANPTGHFNMYVKLIAAGRNIPMRILMGSELGQLASEQDRDNWADTIEARQTDYCEPVIVRPFINRCQSVGTLPKTEQGYTVVWADLLGSSNKEIAEVAEITSRAIVAYANSPAAQDIWPLAAFLDMVMQKSPDEIQKILDLIKEQESQADDEDKEPTSPDTGLDAEPGEGPDAV